jgi:hypothetical protein
MEQMRLNAESVSDEVGRFVLPLPDPGITP